MAEDGSNSMLSVVVFVAVLMAVFALLISGVSGIFGAEDDLPGMRDKSFHAGEFASFSWWTNDESPGWLSNATNDRTGTYWDAPSPGDVAIANLINDHVYIGTAATPYDWSGSGADYSAEHAVRVYLMDSGSIIVFRQGGWGDRWWQEFTVGEIVTSAERQDGGGHIARLQANVGVSVSLVLLFPGGYDPAVLLSSHSWYQFGVGQLPLDKVSTTQDVWGIAGDLLTFNLQATGVWWIDYLFSMAVWSMILYVGFYMITRLLDLIPFT